MRMLASCERGRREPPRPLKFPTVPAAFQAGGCKILAGRPAIHHVSVNADVHGIEAIFVDEEDDEINPLGLKGVGEIGIVGTVAAITNAIYHATGKRVRDLSITIDKLLD
jgi:CO/xanthine dehydrogenase Mo-binding subunit